jgi:hemerythrin superfamily protein
MLNDHALMHKLFIEIEKHIDRDINSLLKSIDEFSWKVEKHYFVEEKAIFTKYESEDKNEGYSMIPMVIKQHDEILKKLQLFKKSIIHKKDFDFQGFKEMLKNHKDFEEGNLYPKLEQELPESEKNEIIQRINEII